MEGNFKFECEGCHEILTPVSAAGASEQAKAVARDYVHNKRKGGLWFWEYNTTYHWEMQYIKNHACNPPGSKPDDSNNHKYCSGKLVFKSLDWF